MQEVLILLVAFLANWGGHWMPWRVVPFLVDEQGKLLSLRGYWELAESMKTMKEVTD